MKRLLLLFAVGLGTLAASAQSQNDTWGKIAGEKKNATYVSEDGNATFRVGDRLKVGLGSDPYKAFVFVRDHITTNKWVKLVSGEFGDHKALQKEAAGKTFTVIGIYDAVDAKSTLIAKHADRTVYVIIEDASKNSYDVAIEQALLAREVIANQAQHEN